MTLRWIADPAMRRAALWLVMQVIWLPPTPRPRHALRLGFTAQDEFFGNRRHDGWAWLKTQAQAWPAAYRSYYWEGFETGSDSFKAYRVAWMRPDVPKKRGRSILPVSRWRRPIVPWCNCCPL